MARSYPRTRPRRERTWVTLDQNIGAANQPLVTNRGNIGVHAEGTLADGLAVPVSFLRIGDPTAGFQTCEATRPFTILATHMTGSLAHKDAATVVGWIGLGISTGHRPSADAHLAWLPTLGRNESPGRFPAVFALTDFGGQGIYEIGPSGSSKGKRRCEVGSHIYFSWSGTLGTADGDVTAGFAARILCQLD